MTEVNNEDEVALARIPCIYYLLRFRKDNQNKVQALINSGSKVNMMTPAYASKLGLQVCQTKVGAQKINASILETFEMILTSF